jgi:hypothetical protein
MTTTTIITAPQTPPKPSRAPLPRHDLNPATSAAHCHVYIAQAFKRQPQQRGD